MPTVRCAVCSSLTLVLCGVINVITIGVDYYRQDMDFSELRYSVGFGVAWISPLGPLKFSLAFPLNKKDDDDVQRFQFQIGTGF